MCAAFFSSRLSNLCWSYIFILLCSKLWHRKANFFYLSVLKNYYAYTYSFFDNISHTFKKKTAIHSLICLLKSFTFDHLFTYIIQTSVNSLTISLTEWPENQKNRCLSFSANSVGLYFRDRVEKIKENLQNGQEKYGGKKLAYVQIWGKNSKIL